MRREAILFLTSDETLEVLLHGLTWSDEYDLITFLLGPDASDTDKRAAAKLALVDLHAHSGLPPILEALGAAIPETEYVLRFALGVPVLPTGEAAQHPHRGD